MANKMKYGVIYQSYPKYNMGPVALAASVAFKALSGKFMTNDGNGVYSISVAGDTQISGWADVGEFTGSSTASADSVVLVNDLNAVFEIPVVTGTTITAATLKALIGKTCDLVVNSTIQQANVGASSTDVVMIVGGDVAENTVYVTLNPAKLYTLGVA